jgi:hypothetical protein
LKVPEGPKNAIDAKKAINGDKKRQRRRLLVLSATT